MNALRLNPSLSLDIPDRLTEKDKQAILNASNSAFVTELEKTYDFGKAMEAAGAAATLQAQAIISFGNTL